MYADEKPTDTIAVPVLVGKNPTLANQILALNGLNIKIEGDGGHSTGIEYQVVSQSIAPGTLVPEGTVVVVKFEKVS